MKSIVKCEHKTENSQVIQVRKGDMTKEEVDVIVNAANGRLDHSDGLAGAISRAGGPIIQQESDAYWKKNGKVPEGGLFVSSGGNLKVKYVFHAVGPTWHGGDRAEDYLLKSAVSGCLQKAHELKCKSISIPGG